MLYLGPSEFEQQYEDDDDQEVPYRPAEAHPVIHWMSSSAK